ncbi:MAG: hypothetical protein E6J90_15610 [Deltaproteobacteria bacterium]|nr:MAG: hypothetical protein E6J90_15610 [Deltaproteobacteria bacterium]
MVSSGDAHRRRRLSRLGRVHRSRTGAAAQEDRAGVRRPARPDPAAGQPGAAARRLARRQGELRTVVQPVGPTWRVFALVRGAPSTADFMNLPATDMEIAHGPAVWKAGEVIEDVQDITLRPDWRSATATLSVGLIAEGKHGIDDRMAASGPHAQDRAAVARVLDVDLARAPAPPGTVYVPHAIGPIAIDGLASEPTWAAAATSPELVTAEGSPDPVGKAVARLTWDDQFLYAFLAITDSDVWSDYRNHDDPLWKQDCVELFIDADGNRRGYVELQVNPNNATFDSWFATTRAQPGDPSWDSGMQTAVKLHGTTAPGDTDQGWDVEVAIPWQAVRGRDEAMAVRLPPQVGDRWRMNIVRVDLKTGDKNPTASSWNRITSADFHALDRMLTVVFADSSGSIAPAPAGLGERTRGAGPSQQRALTAAVATVIRAALLALEAMQLRVDPEAPAQAMDLRARCPHGPGDGIDVSAVARQQVLQPVVAGIESAGLARDRLHALQRRGAHRHRQMLVFDRAIAGQDECGRDGLLQLADVAGPRVRVERPDRGGRELDRLGSRRRMASEQVLQQGAEIFATRAQRGQRDREAGQAGEQVGAKRLARDGRRHGSPSHHPPEPARLPGAPGAAPAGIRAAGRRSRRATAYPCRRNESARGDLPGRRRTHPCGNRTARIPAGSATAHRSSLLAGVHCGPRADGRPARRPPSRYRAPRAPRSGSRSARSRSGHGTAGRARDFSSRARAAAPVCRSEPGAGCRRETRRTSAPARRGLRIARSRG